MDNKKKIIVPIIIGVIIILIALGTTIAFFNYTRTGSLNNLGTGRIYFNSTQNGTLNMTNIFPMTSVKENGSTLDSVTVGIVGDTTCKWNSIVQMTYIIKINDLLYFKGKREDIHIKLEQAKDSDFGSDLKIIVSILK